MARNFKIFKYKKTPVTLLFIWPFWGKIALIFMEEEYLPLVDRYPGVHRRAQDHHRGARGGGGGHAHHLGPRGPGQHCDGGQSSPTWSQSRRRSLLLLLFTLFIQIQP